MLRTTNAGSAGEAHELMEGFTDVTKADTPTPENTDERAEPPPGTASDASRDTASAASEDNGTASGTEAAIELVGIAKRFHSRRGTVNAVERVDLVIGEGEFFSLLGPSGCGKTTTLRMIGGFEEPSEGQILLYGRDVVGVPPNHRDVNMVFQSYALFPHMSVFDNVAFGLRRKSVDRAETTRRVNDMLELVQLDAKADRRYAMGPYDYNIAWILLFFPLGVFGLHRFYLGKIITGLIWFFTGGLLGFGWLYDLWTLNEQVSDRNLQATRL